MAKIHALVYIIVGLFVSIASWKLNYEKLIFFFYVGLIFVLIGVAKLIFSLMKNRTGRAQNLHHKIHQQPQSFKRCHKCSNVIRFHDKFCSRCGIKI